ncbi:hypothetical protein [Kitasatospora sp. NPDC002965]|uniref:hypothetical protein n=1 Tax=Kitasatospora sp. NPDC002965 TaxID=3154775 RepID=UPI0033B223E1
MTADGGRARVRAGVRHGAVARSLLLCALLAGLFLMHGSPTAAGGCHAPAVPSVPTVAGHHHAPDAPDGPPGSDPRAAGPRTAHGDAPQAASCVTARDRDGAGLPASPLSAGAAVVLIALRPPDGPRGRRADGPRAPPAGRRLLSQVCVSRT